MSKIFHGHLPHKISKIEINLIHDLYTNVYLISYMAEFSYAGKTITEELRNAKSNQNIRG